MRDTNTNEEVERLKLQVAALEQQLEVYQQEALEKSNRLEQALGELREYAQQLTNSQEALSILQQTQAQLIQTEKMSSLGQLVAGVAHEINNPVNFIAGNLIYTKTYTQDLIDLLHLYQQHYPDPVPDIKVKKEDIELDFLIADLPKMLNSMQLGAERIRQIVLSLRNFSRLDEAAMKRVNIHEGLISTLVILQNRLKARFGNFRVQVVEEYSNLPLVECYASQLNQVFINILNNALDALEELNIEDSLDHFQPANVQPINPTIWIHTAVLEASSRVVIQIRDNGPGMTEEVRRRVFDPFFTTKNVGNGVGLGLTICYQIIVEKHGGVLECFSEPGQGAEFRIEIPIDQNQSPT